MSTLDAGVERPETRTFDVDVLALARAERPHLVAAGLTILRAWHNTEQKEEGAKLDPFGGFDDWSQRIRQALVWLDQADPCETIVKVRKGDPERLALYAVMEQWRLKLGVGGSFSVPRVIEIADVDPDFHPVLMAVASGQTGISSSRLSKWLRRNERKVIGGFRFQQAGMLHGYPLWSLVKA
jgi:putative DNA primase/helicase